MTGSGSALGGDEASGAGAGAGAVAGAAVENVSGQQTKKNRRRFNYRSFFSQWRLHFQREGALLIVLSALKG